MPYYLYRDNRISGPYKLDDVQALSGDPDTLICEEEAGVPDGRWHSVMDLFGQESFSGDFLVNEGQVLDEEFEELKWAAPFFNKDIEKSKNAFPQFEKTLEDVSFDWSETSLFQMAPQRPDLPAPPASLELREEVNAHDFEQILKRYLNAFEERFESFKNSPLSSVPPPPSAPPLPSPQIPLPPVSPPAPVKLDLKPVSPISIKPEETLAAPVLVEHEEVRQDGNPEELRFQMGESWDSLDESSAGGLQIQMGDSLEAVDEPVQENQNLILRAPDQESQDAQIIPIQSASESPVEIIESKPVELESPLTPSSNAEPAQIQISSAPVEFENPVQASPAGEANSFVFPASNQNPEGVPAGGNVLAPGAPESLIQFSSPVDAASSAPGQFSPQNIFSEAGPQIAIENSIQTAQGSASEPLITPIFNEPNSPSVFPGAAPEGFGAFSPPVEGAPAPFQTPPDSQELLDRFAKPESAVPDKNQTKKSAKKSRSKLLPVLGLGVVVLAAVSFFLFFRNPRDISNMLNPGSTQKPLGLDQSSPAPIPGSQPEQSLSMPPAQTAASPAPSAQTESPAPISSEQKNPTPNSTEASSPSPSSPLAQGSEEQQSEATPNPSKKAIELVKQYPLLERALDRSKVDVRRWLDYEFGAGADVKEEWSAGKVSQGVYLVRYRVTFGNSSKRKSIVYLFQADTSGGMVLGDNGAARRLLSGEAPKTRR